MNSPCSSACTSQTPSQHSRVRLHTAIFPDHSSRRWIIILHLAPCPEQHPGTNMAGGLHIPMLCPLEHQILGRPIATHWHTHGRRYAIVTHWHAIAAHPQRYDTFYVGELRVRHRDCRLDDRAKSRACQNTHSAWRESPYGWCAHPVMGARPPYDPEYQCGGVRPSCYGGQAPIYMTLIDARLNLSRECACMCL